MDITTDSEFGEEAGSGRFRFPATRWTRVVAANGNGAEAERALNELCGLYWYPLYAFVRRQGNSPEDAQDLTQGFFADLLRSEALGRVDRDKGRLRSFLLGAMKNYMAYEHRKDTAQKRGGGAAPVLIEGRLAERRYALDSLDGDSPDRQFDRRWALEILERVVVRLGVEYEAKGMGRLFEVLAPLLAGQAGTDHAAIAPQLEMSAGAVRTALSRMRKRYRACLISEIADTVATPDLVEEELQCLVAALRGGAG